MHSTALMPHAVQPPSPGSEEETSMDRVFFGPFQTPEKRFTAIATIPDPDPTCLQPSQDVVIRPRTRSGSPSSPASTNSNEIMDVEKLLEVSKQEHEDNEIDMITPLASGIPVDTEISSALASRLLCAPGNPSPPPSPTLLPAPDDADTDEANTDGDGEGLATNCAAPSSPTLDPPHLTISPVLASATIEEPDLMSFHSFDDRLNPVAFVPSGQEIAGQAPPSPFSFPDTVSPGDTSTHRAFEPFQGRTEVLIDVQDEPSAVLVPVSPQENDEITEGVDNLSGEDVPTVPPSESPPTPNPNGDTLEPQVVQDSPHTPLRRSSRPRKSATPHILKYATPASVEEDQTSSPLRATRSSAQTRKNKKGKERASSPSKGEENPGIFEIAQQPGPLNLGDRPSDVKSQRRSSTSPVRRVFTRELGSLSPNSTELLSNLVPSTEPVESEVEAESIGNQPTTPVSNIQLDCPADPICPTSEISPPTPSSSGVKSTNGVSSPARIPVTPRKTYTPSSPSKLRFQPASLDDPTRTPARRVPIEQAVAEGHISPQKLLQMQSGSLAPVSMFTGQTLPVLNMSLKGDSSPARRVQVAPATTSERALQKASSERARVSESPSKQPVALPALQKRAKVSQPAKLPFPLTAPSERKVESSDHLHHSANQPKSSLKQVSSRIPRKKPYSRPPVTPAAREPRKSSFIRAVAPPQNLAESNTSKPVVKSGSAKKARNDVPAPAKKRIIRAVDLTKSSVKQNDVVSDPPLCDPSADAKIDVDGTSAVGILKRKRIDSKPTTHTDSRSLISRRPTTTPTLSSSTSTTARPSATSSIRSNKSTSNAKPPVMKFRRVMPPTAAAPAQPSRSQPPSQSLASQPPIHESSPETNLTTNGQQVSEASDEMHPPVNEAPTLSPPATARSDSTETSPLITSPQPVSPPQPPQHSPQSLVFVIDPLSPVSPPNTLPPEYSNEQAAPSGRRRTRNSNSAQFQLETDVFQSYSGTTTNTVRPSQRRRNSSVANSRMDDVFSSMSMNALKTLTASNTARNQQYVAASLETEIVRKNGCRPESPAVKIKTIVQRQQEEKVKQREERAARRARRHGNSDIDEELEGDIENEGYASPTPGNHSWDAPVELPIKHRRGAGDDEDYETPFKAIDGEKRRVKWDKGLYTQVYLDEVVPAMKAVAKENMAMKGCLTPSAKKLQLDTLGNLVEAENPLSDLARENIVVKKFIYDDDVEVAPPPSAIPVPRNTRSRTKKGKG